MKEIKLTQGKVAIVDNDDFEKLNQFKWCVAKNCNNYYAQRAIRVDGNRETITMHRMILDQRPGYEIDHKDGNGLHNWRENLRYATHGQNLANGRKRSGTSSIFKGVCWHRSSKKWISQIRKDGGRLHLGLFTNETGAALAYDEAARKYHGEFAKTNF